MDAQGLVKADFFPDPLAMLFKAVDQLVLAQAVNTISVVPAALPTDVSIQVFLVLGGHLELEPHLKKINGILRENLLLTSRVELIL